MTALALALTDLNTTVNHEPRISHRRLAEALGFVQRHKFGHLIERHAGAMARFGEVPSTVDETGPKGGRPGKIFWLNKRQALYLCTKSETPNATEVVIQMVEVFDAWMEGKLKPAVEHKSKAEKIPHYFESGSNVLLDLSCAVESARLRIQDGVDDDFGSALAHVLDDMIEERGNPNHRPKGKLGDWNWRRVDARNEKSVRNIGPLRWIGSN
jgi:hypothetical protein